MARGNFTKRKINTYELFDTYGICHMSHGKSFLFDLEDLPHVQAHYWTVNSGRHCRKTGSRDTLLRRVLKEFAPRGGC